MDLIRAIEIAQDAHAGQVSRDGTPFIEHPMRVMGAATSVDAQIVSVLHDVVGRSTWTIQALKDAGLHGDLADAIDALTRRGDERYDDYVERVICHSLAREVKVLELEDMANMGRSDESRASYSERLANYLGFLLTIKSRKD